MDAKAKRPIALHLVEEGWNKLGETAISVQVLQELNVNLTRLGRTPAEAAQVVGNFEPWPKVENTFALLKAGLEEQKRWKLSLWDALILAAARASGATELVSEDFNHGQDYSGVKAVNPFR